ncbi:Gar1/Naf1 RNA binding region-domain-containing protein [Xylariales sp. PMI_506]|nr:Gar1/Naf1 RNA binding region-domain-containing protein [Xylariales sp. PMI_506]
MASNSFQIPGLSTLSQTESGQEGSSAQTSQPVVSTEEQAHVAADTEMVVQETPAVVETTESPKVEAVSAADNTAMEVDQPDASAEGTSRANVAESAPSPPSLTVGLEALLGGLDPLPGQAASSTTQQPEAENVNAEMQDVGQEQGQAHPEWEEDSSPYESSSDSSSSDDSDDDDDSDDGKALLNPEEMARILMEAGSDDEGEGRAKGSASASQLRTKNEQPEVIVPKPDVTITPEMKIEELGEIEYIVESSVVIKAKTSGEYRVLDSGSVLFTEDRTVIAALADLIGSVREPRYTALFTNAEDIQSLNLSLGTKIYYTPEHATFVFTEPLKGLRGTDASNLHDEEIGDEEIEFSDDEKEAAHKREQKEKRRARHGGRGGGGSSSRGAPGAAQDASAGSNSLKYDDDDEDGPYRPLSRPSNFGQAAPGTFTHGSTPGQEQPQSGTFRGGRGGRGRGRPHDRGNRGGRGGQRGGSGHSLPPRTQGYTPQPQQQAYPSFPIPPPQVGNQGYPIPPPPPQFFGAAAGGQQPFPFPAWPQNPSSATPVFVPPPPQFQQPAQNAQGNNMYNAAFYAALQAQLQGQNQNGQPQGHWSQQGGSG